MDNPFKNLSKINPKKKNGHREIENSLFHALIRARLSGAEYQTALLVMDRTWGYGKDFAPIPYSKFIEFTGLSRESISNAVKKLEVKRIVIVERTGAGKQTLYRFNKYWDTWITSSDDLTSSVELTSSDYLTGTGSTHPTPPGETKSSPESLTSQPTRTSQPLTPGTEPVKKTILKKTIKDNYKGAPVVKPPDPLNEKRKKIFEELKKRRGYNSPSPGGEAKAITWMLKQGYTVEQIMSAHDKMAADSFWQGKFLSMASVKNQIGAILNGGTHGQYQKGVGGAGAHSLKDSITNPSFK